MSAKLAEIAGALTAHGDLIAASVDLDFDEDSGELMLTVTVRGGHDLVELLMELRQVVDVAQARALSARYGIPPQALEDYIRGRGKP